MHKLSIESAIYIISNTGHVCMILHIAILKRSVGNH